MKWSVSFLKESRKDLLKLDNSRIQQVFKALEKVSKKPVSFNEGGYGKPLGNLINTKLSGLFKIKLKNLGIRIVYKLVKVDNEMLIIVIGMRADEEVYEIAQKRVNKYNLK